MGLELYLQAGVRIRIFFIFFLASLSFLSFPFSASAMSLARPRAEQNAFKTALPVHFFVFTDESGNTDSRYWKGLATAQEAISHLNQELSFSHIAFRLDGITLVQGRPELASINQESDAWSVYDYLVHQNPADYSSSTPVSVALQIGVVQRITTGAVSYSAESLGVSYKYLPPSSPGKPVQAIVDVRYVTSGPVLAHEYGHLIGMMHASDPSLTSPIEVSDTTPCSQSVDYFQYPLELATEDSRKSLMYWSLIGNQSLKEGEYAAAFNQYSACFKESHLPYFRSTL